MRYELWLKDKGGTTFLHSSDDPGELYVMYKDATDVYDREELILTAADRDSEIYVIDVTWLRRAVLQRTTVPE